MGRRNRQRKQRTARRPDGAGEIVRRVRQHVSSVQAVYPDAWRRLADYRRRRDQLGGWPSWCWVPLQAAAEIARDRPLPEQAIVSPLLPSDTPVVAVLGGLAAWRQTRTIYRFHGELHDALLATDLQDRLPASALRLPEWCPYLAFPAGSALGDGMFACLNWDPAAERPELVLLLDRDGILSPQLLPLDRPTIGQAITDALANLIARLHGRPAHEDIRDADPEQVEHDLHALAAQRLPADQRHLIDEMLRSLRQTLPACLSLLFYLGAEEPDILDPDQPTAESAWRPAPIGPVGPPLVWEVGWRVSASLRAAHGAPGDGEPRGPGRRPRPHVRRGHWHHYWTGPMTGPRQLVLRWVHPTLVAADDQQPPPVTTVHDLR